MTITTTKQALSGINESKLVENKPKFGDLTHYDSSTLWKPHSSCNEHTFMTSHKLSSLIPYFQKRNSIFEKKKTNLFLKKEKEKWV